MIVGDEFRLVYCTAVTFRLLKIEKTKDRMHTWKMLTGINAGKTFTNKQKDVDAAMKLKDWDKIN